MESPLPQDVPRLERDGHTLPLGDHPGGVVADRAIGGDLGAIRATADLALDMRAAGHGLGHRRASAPAPGGGFFDNGSPVLSGYNALNVNSNAGTRSLSEGDGLETNAAPPAGST